MKFGLSTEKECYYLSRAAYLSHKKYAFIYYCEAVRRMRKNCIEIDRTNTLGIVISHLPKFLKKAP